MRKLRSGAAAGLAARRGREGRRSLKLYVDGQPVAESTAFNPADYDLSNSSRLRIGCGEHDCFNGKMKDLRLYRRALGEEDVRTLAKP